jgi:hypothetical protein
LAIVRQRSPLLSGAAAIALNSANLLQLVKVMTARGQFGNSFCELSRADLFICFGAYKLPQFAAAEFPGVEFFCVHDNTTCLLLRRGRPLRGGIGGAEKSYFLNMTIA